MTRHFTPQTSAPWLELGFRIIGLMFRVMVRVIRVCVIVIMVTSEGQTPGGKCLTFVQGYLPASTTGVLCV